MPKAKLIAIHLPQYHPTKENDEWWEKGFTEWTNVTKAKPLFTNHYQPRLPADLGFYDLRVPEVRAAQAELARNAGIEGFCYWHYWFDGKKLLERPVEEIVKSGEPDFPFCLGWANHTWSSHWIGAERRTLIEQTYPGPEDHEKHFYDVLPALKDQRYICVHKKPMFVIFRPAEIPNCKDFIDQWQRLAKENGLNGIHFVAHLFDDELEYPYSENGYDAAVVTNELKLMKRRFGDIVGRRLKNANSQSSLSNKVFGYLDTLKCITRLTALRTLQRLLRRPGGIHYYEDALLFLKAEGPAKKGQYPSIVPGWDNTARAGRKGIVLHNSTPERFKSHAVDILKSVSQIPEEERIVFIKSWNEWAEGNYMEPDRKYGTAYLDALKEAISETETPNANTP
ncbi:glycoside hydrolase family 99-like domain-containing protein [Pelagicoccus sp. SDUM812003]|uniref:glycosyltransferase WbsX family protein n=1 Tax=Pelagicoccus sp. SDUM812003 TaxID=3041267 RepID=UPI00280E3A1A|nr:glycoside hydrolase family 99-like domain-containing protein [Pelagicoccus sp. SDUM812003]MDQ8204992.1 glycoside hydrolase family 99-like domain-containing protein [Pelagicoccus sp. SDUM812003]